MFSDGNRYRGNRFFSNAAGVAVMYSKHIVMESNAFENSAGSASYGLLLKDIGKSAIRGNSFRGNTVGAYMEGCTDSLLEGNLFFKNGWALRVLSNSDGNRIEKNDFDSNTFDVSTNGGGNHNEFAMNRWSAYTGIDLNGDSFGDLPHRPVKLSSVLMERFPVSALLVKSLLFSLIDDAESAFPVLTPDNLVDRKPFVGRKSP
jgi:nitrous oxidase accessory protein